MELTYQIALENLRSRMNLALGITKQGFSSSEACLVPWATNPRLLLQRNLDADATDHLDARKNPPMTSDPKDLARASSISSMSEDINPEGAPPSPRPR